MTYHFNTDRFSTVSNSIASDIRAMSTEGHEPFVILRYVTGEGVEFPDAVALVTRILKLSDEDREEMETDYSERI